MKEELKHLIQLQQIDSKILYIKRILDEIPFKISEAEFPLKELQNSSYATNQKLDSLEKKKRSQELKLDEISDRINKLKARISDIKTNKEYQAHLKEIESVEKERYEIEDDILTIMEEIDTISKQLKTGEEKLESQMNKIEAFKKKIEQEKSEIEKELLNVRDMRSRVVDSIEKELYNQYISLIDTCNGLAVAEAKDEICMGCNMNIPPQLFVELKKNEDIIFCPQCRRILYFRNTT